MYYTQSIPEKVTYKIQGTKSMNPRTLLCIFTFSLAFEKSILICNQTHLDNENNLVDPESGLKEIAHVYCGELNGKRIRYMVVSALVDIQCNKNSYFRMQLLESNDSQS